MIIAVDFDGTLVKHTYPEIGIEVPMAFITCKRLKEQGNAIILWTCREHSTNPGEIDLLQEAIDFCKLKGLIFDAVNANLKNIGFDPSPKIYADIYIDDRNFGGVNWNAIYKSLVK
jgi:predicted mannosyl-3-phosphoglycerate phosphatase (HAD superfamily)